MGTARRSGLEHLPLALEALLDRQRAALVDGDWRQVSVCVEGQEALLDQLDGWQPTAEERPTLRRLRRAAARNARLANRLAEGVANRLRGPRSAPIYTKTARLSDGARALLDLRG